MSFDSLLINTCTILRFTEGAADAYGRKVKTWGNHLVAQPCRLMDAGGREVQVGNQVVIADYKLFLKHIDVTEQDRVLIGAITYEILLVEDHQDSTTAHHLECLLRTVR